MNSDTLTEDFKPLPIDLGAGRFAALRFRLRTLVDLQMLTCVQFIKSNRDSLSGKVLDVGCGQMPFRHLLPDHTEYTGIDIPAATSFGMRHSDVIVAFNGQDVPFPDNHFDAIMCTEVLEHAERPEALIAEMLRVLRPGGAIVLTVPFSARVHHIPYDFHRFTRYRLLQMFAGFGDVDVQERGNDLAVIANKIIVVTMRQIMPFRLLRMPSFLLCVPAALLSLIVAHCALLFGLGSALDPLGYGLVARKR